MLTEDTGYDAPRTSIFLRPDSRSSRARTHAWGQGGPAGLGTSQARTVDVQDPGAGPGSRPGRWAARGGVAGRARPGRDVTSGALCIVGIPGRPRVVPVHWFQRSRAEGASAGRAGGKRGGVGGPAGRSAERSGASGRQGSGPTPCSRPVSAARASEPQAAGPHRLGPARPPAAAVPSGPAWCPGELGRVPSVSGLHGARQGPVRAVRGSGWFCSESKPGNQLLLETHPCPRRGALWERGPSGPLPGR